MNEKFFFLSLSLSLAAHMQQGRQQFYFDLSELFSFIDFKWFNAHNQTDCVRVGECVRAH